MALKDASFKEGAVPGLARRSGWKVTVDDDVKDFTITKSYEDWLEQKASS